MKPLKFILILGIIIGIIFFIIKFAKESSDSIENSNSAISNIQNSTDLENDIASIINTNTSTKVTNTVTQTNVTEDNNMTKIQFQTSEGNFTLELFNDDAPNTVANFEKLVREGFYNGTRFHRVIENFMIQGGDPQSMDTNLKDRWGTGGPGYKFADEIHANNHNVIGTIAMANSGPNTNGSQFFINTADNNFLDTKHTVFGKVTDGIDVIMKISHVETDSMDRPLEDVVVEKVLVK